MLKVVCWIWRGERIYLPEHVNVLRRMLARHLHVPHRVVCITDERDGFDSGIEVVPTPAAARRVAAMKSPEGDQMPSCYRRLWMFSDEAREIGDRVLLTDVDLVVTGDMTQLVARAEPFVGWLPRGKWGNQKHRIAGGLYLMTTGAHMDVWNDFGPDGVAAARAAGYRGSDQAWLSHKIGARAALWGSRDGIYALSDLGRRPVGLPNDARLVQFAGHLKPWDEAAMKLRWVAANYH